MSFQIHIHAMGANGPHNRGELLMSHRNVLTLHGMMVLDTCFIYPKPARAYPGRVITCVWMFSLHLIAVVFKR
eukprot:1153031-Pelagomonas_calceolata.AAC.1